MPYLNNKRRCVIIVLDGAGVGAMPDAARFGDEGANTLAHVLAAAGREYYLPNLAALGLYNLLGLPSPALINGAYAKLACASPAKDTTAGHWELAGLVLERALPTYPDGFPADIIEEFERAIGTKTLGNCTASGTEIIAKLGEEHLRTGFPIVYTSADSVFQVAAHESAFGLDRLYRACVCARALLKGIHAVGRVIARPFEGAPGGFVRTANRRDYSLEPFAPTILDAVRDAGGEVVAIGKIEDIFCGRGITGTFHTTCNREGMQRTLAEVSAGAGRTPSLIMTNLVDFDMAWGHRRNAAAYADGLKEFDGFLPDLFRALSPQDVLFITADHGCDPTYMRHTDHTREYVPLLIYGPAVRHGVNLGVRSTFADVAATIADMLGLPQRRYGTSFNGEIWNKTSFQN